MSLRDTIATIHRVENGRLFKIIASAVVVLLGILGVVSYTVAVHRPVSVPTLEGALGEGPALTAEEAKKDPKAAAEEKERKDAIASAQRMLDSVLSARQSVSSVVVGTVVGVGLALVVIWLGLGLTYFSLLTVGAALTMLFWAVPPTRKVAPLLVGIIALTASFTALLQLLRLVLAGSNAVFAIARNVLAEAVRLKLSLIFIVLLVFGLAVLPITLDETQPLRYRVQTFMQYATGGSFWIIAILVLLFSVSTVAFEQRDRVIWQTMTKPVAAWQYVLGKWLGVSSLALVLLAVSGSGIFLFTEYLRSQPALGEEKAQAYLATGGEVISEDRMVLETQVLAARITTKADAVDINWEQFEKNVNARVDAEIERAPDFAALGPNAEAEKSRIREKLRKDLYDNVQRDYRTIPPGETRQYTFSGLREAKEGDRPLLMKYKISAGSNSPDQTYKLTFEFVDGATTVREVNLNQTVNLPLLTTAVDADGVLAFRVTNGDLVQNRVNPERMSFPPGDGLEISYSAGSYRVNFFRVMVVLWIKLAFLAMLAIAAGTFLSFPVACLVAFGCFWAAESAGFLKSSLENWQTEDEKTSKILIVRYLIDRVAFGVSWLFQTYHELKPTQRLVDGVLLSWGEVAWGTAVLALWTVVLYVAGSYIFSKRELATYSGH